MRQSTRLSNHVRLVIPRVARASVARDGALQPTELGGRDGLAAITEQVRAEMRAALAARETR
ncbi:MAG: hypothetical protein ABJ215_15980 [Alphaproteobacteria bacterium]